MMHDVRAGEAFKKFQAVLTGVQALGPQRFAALLDTADKDEMDDLLIAADVLLDSIARAQKL
jgi:hypothetical protein